jgi:hypothetical protein
LNTLWLLVGVVVEPIGVAAAVLVVYCKRLVWLLRLVLR